MILGWIRVDLWANEARRRDYLDIDKVTTTGIVTWTRQDFRQDVFWINYKNFFRIRISDSSRNFSINFFMNASENLFRDGSRDSTYFFKGSSITFSRHFSEDYFKSFFKNEPRFPQRDSKESLFNFEEFHHIFSRSFSETFIRDFFTKMFKYLQECYKGCFKQF